MSRRSSKTDAGTGFLRKLAWTVLLALVFSAGLITGQRMLDSETRAPLVSVTSSTGAEASDEKVGSSASDEQKEPLFSFYDRLSEGIDPETSDSNRSAGDEEPGATDAPADQQEPKAESSQPETPSESTDSADDEPTPPAAREKSAKEDSTPDAAKYTLQVSAFPKLDRARARIRQLAQKGLDAHVVSAEIPDKGTYYRVRIGKFESMTKAEKFQAEIKTKRGVDTFVTPL